MAAGVVEATGNVRLALSPNDGEEYEEKDERSGRNTYREKAESVRSIEDTFEQLAESANDESQEEWESDSEEKSLPWSSLWRCVQELDKWLNRFHSSNSFKSLGLLLPILSRWFDDLDHRIHDPEINSKTYRQGLDRDEAKALAVMQQKWPKLRKQETNVDLCQIIEQHPVHMPIVGLCDLPTRAVLDSLERVLLGLSRRVALPGLKLTTLPAAVVNFKNVISWYLSFGPIFGFSSSSPLRPSLADRTRDIILGIKDLDLSRNSLTEIPRSLPLVLPGLCKLNLSGNPLGCLPASLCQWKLVKLSVDPPTRQPSGRQRLARILACASDPPTLVESCLSRLIKSPARPGLPVVPAPQPPLPAHLSRALAKGRLCDNCHRFRWSAQKAIYLRAPPDYAIRGFNGNRLKPHFLILGPSFLCPACLHLHCIRTHAL
ncbi:hypothetical protein PtA15_15A86 [Puccinia triticina]|uniref:Uncharacterized protein n=1 Tax=Puccinia triticina TaxID=208348 RepID=A0ABY7D484_9BASI|nr:uncharacterized protein PtA15_15A86 [Puccinia triticina]WAQ91695.1 hypothetical protein PtA15_15A86 [Puccinia triticina]